MGKACYFPVCMMVMASLGNPAISGLPDNGNMPDNDNFADGEVVEGRSGSVKGTNLGATREEGEPLIDGDAGGGSVWWRWEAPRTEHVTVNTFGSGFDTLLGVYTGTAVDLLAVEAENDDRGDDVQSLVEFEAVAGTLYHFAVDGYDGESGNILLNWFSGKLANDNFADAQVLEGPSGRVSGTNLGATREVEEPLIDGDAGGGSVWWTWEAPRTEEVTVNTFGSDFDTLLGVYTGLAVDSLAVVAENDDGGDDVQSLVDFEAVAGTLYHFAVDGYDRERGVIVLSWSSGRPANDNFADAQVVEGPSGSVTGTNLGATREVGEPLGDGDADGGSVWWMWVAPRSERVTVDTFGSDFDTLLGVYTGTAVNSLGVVAENDDEGDDVQSLVEFEAVAGTLYHFAVDGYDGESGNIILNWSLAPEGGTTPFRRGDVLDDGMLNLTDGVLTLNFLFLNGAAPSCLKSADMDDSGDINLTDGVYLLNYLFLNGPEPALPLASCGGDPTADALSCGSHRACQAPH